MECGCLISTTNNFPCNTRERLSNEKPLRKNLKKQESNSEEQKRISYRCCSHFVRLLEEFDTLRKDEILCDIKLETEDGTLVFGHKVVLASATPYFRAMFSSFEESKKNHVILQELDSTAVKLLVDFIYTGQIMVTEDNVQALLSAANLLQLHDVKEACCDFLQTLLSPKNCLGFKTLVSLYDCMEYLSIFKCYVIQNFSEMIEGNEYLNLLYDELVEIISCDELNTLSEEKVFECVVNWVNHDLSNRKNVFPKLMEHVRLPLASIGYLYNRVREEPLMKTSLECRDYLEEALYFHASKFEKPDIIRFKHRQPVNLSKVIIIVVGSEINNEKLSMQWFDLSINKWQHCPEIRIHRIPVAFGVLNDRFLFYISIDGVVFMSDLTSSSPHFKVSEPMLTIRGPNPGVGVLENCIYAIGGNDYDGFSLKSAEVYLDLTQEWQMISEMTFAREGCGVGVLNNHIYAVGGCNNGVYDVSKSAERYCPKTDRWTTVADMKESRYKPGIGVLNGVMYVVGGFNGYQFLNSVEAYNPRSNTWTTVSDMHKKRCFESTGVTALNGLLYATSNEDESKIISTEIYDSKSNIWTMISGILDTFDCIFGTVAINKPSCFKTKV